MLEMNQSIDEFTEFKFIYNNSKYPSDLFGPMSNKMQKLVDIPLL